MIPMISEHGMLNIFHQCWKVEHLIVWASLTSTDYLNHTAEWNKRNTYLFGTMKILYLIGEFELTNF